MIRARWLKTIALKGKYQGMFVWLPLAILSVLVGASLWHSFAEHIQEAETKARTLTRVVEQHATATLDRSNLALLAVIERIQPGDLSRSTLLPERRQALTRILETQHRQTRGVVSMSLTDADGLVLANSVGMAPGVDLGQRGYFKELKSGPPGGGAVSEVIKGKVSNKWGLQIARRVDLPDGSFGGMIVANLGLYENFEKFYETLDVGPQGLVTLRSQDNKLLVRLPVVESALGTTLQGSKGTEAVAAQVSETIVRSVSPIDQVERITSVRKLPDYPVYASVGVAYMPTLLSWLGQSSPLLILSFILLPLSGLVSVLAGHRFEMLQELREAEHALAQERDARHVLLEKEVAERTADLQLANQKLESFLYAASHDLKGPLGRISSFSTLLERDCRDRLEGDGLLFLDFIRENALRLTKLVDDLLTHARIDQQACHLQPVDLRQAIQLAINKKIEDIREAGALVRLEMAPVQVLADPHGLSQVFNNLLENALKYSAETAEPVIEIGGQEVDGGFRFWVRDNGIGFDMEYHDKIFEIFRRLHTHAEYAGSGVGLALVKRAMERMGGKVWAESEPGQGATFYLELAVAPQALPCQ